MFAFMFRGMCCVVALFLLTSTCIMPTVAQRYIRFSNCTVLAKLLPQRVETESGMRLYMAGYHGSKEGGKAIRSLVVSPCNSDPCTVPAGSSINISFELLSNQNSSFVRLDPRVRLLGLELPIPGVERDACKLMATNITCPVSEGQPVRGTVPVHVYNFVPPVTAVTVWRVYGNMGLMACGTTTVTVTRP